MRTSRADRRPSTRALLLVGIAVTLVLAGVVAFYASSSPDGLNRVASDLGFAGAARDPATSTSPLSDYAVRGVASERLSSGLAGVLGVLVVGALMTGLLLVLRRRPGRREDG